MNTIPSIPTTYKERLYRSRLEARWAAMFDLLGWKYEYEPFDMEGWVPDFALFGRKETLLVEVKPFASFDEFRNSKTVAKLCFATSLTKYAQSPVLLLGCTVLEEYEGLNLEGFIGLLGWLLCPIGHGKDRRFMYDDVFVTNRAGLYDFYTSDGWRVQPYFNPQWEDHFTEVLSGSVSYTSLLRLWNIAGNAVQYKRPRSRRISED